MGIDAAPASVPIRWVSRKRRLPLHGLHIPRGTWLFVFATLLIGVVGIDTEANLLVVLFGLCVAALAVNVLAGWLCLRRLEVSRQVPEGVVAGQTLEIKYQLTNRQRWTRAYSLHVVDRVDCGGVAVPIELFVPVLGPRETITVSRPIVWRRRGRVQFDQIAIGTCFPFGLLTKFATVSIPHTTIVYPSLGSAREQRWMVSRWADPASVGGARDVLGDEEFHSLREYRLGDNPRRIHWRYTAKSRVLMVRELAPRRSRQVWIVLDSRIPPGDAELADKLEQAISAAATVACAAIESGCRVGFLCNGEPLLILPPAGSRDSRLRILRELALRAPNTDDRLSDRLGGVHWPGRWRGMCMVFAARANDDLARSAELLLQRIGNSSLYVVGSPAFKAIYSGEAGGRRPSAAAELVRWSSAPSVARTVGSA